MENITVKILSKEYQISCPTDLKEELKAAVNYLDGKMLEIRNQGKIISFEGMLITAAINLAFEVHQKQDQHNVENTNLAANLTLLTNKLNDALQKPFPSNKLKFEYNNITD